MNLLLDFPKLKQLQKQYYSLNKKLDEAQDFYMDELKKSKCSNCNILNINLFKIPLKERHIHCSNCGNDSKILKAAEIIIKFKEEVKSFSRDIYAKEIFHSLKNVKPTIYNKIAKKNVTWEEVFGTSYEDNLQNSKYNLLINLLHESGPFFIAS
jgi:hypothetical protein